MSDQAFLDRLGRRVTLHEVDDGNWRAVADVAPLDEQRAYVAALAARYLLLSIHEEPWRSLAVCADGAVVGHVMWGRDEEGAHWIGGLMVDRAEQGRGVGRALLRALLARLAAQPDCRVIRLSYQLDNVAARELYESTGFVRTRSVEDAEELGEEEIVAELTAEAARRAAAAERPGTDAAGPGAGRQP
ncbi:GNAT family N-acetyltransferase [Streptomyces sp. JJ36]|uniref:GNAT family N-acetyltransferase n=1 Tax=Streptomyces sp. JJ36 TaxID=2736645 RepID=UPI001F2DCAB5|nr:GNAT family N-acetyltransferase [Streptomyces sp. JJ36]